MPRVGEDCSLAMICDVLTITKTSMQTPVIAMLVKLTPLLQGYHGIFHNTQVFFFSNVAL